MGRNIKELETIAKKFGTSSHVILPKEWKNKKVLVKLSEVEK